MANVKLKPARRATRSSSSLLPCTSSYPLSVYLHLDRSRSHLPVLTSSVRRSVPTAREKGVAALARNHSSPTTHPKPHLVASRPGSANPGRAIHQFVRLAFGTAGTCEQDPLLHAVGGEAFWKVGSSVRSRSFIYCCCCYSPPVDRDDGVWPWKLICADVASYLVSDLGLTPLENTEKLLKERWSLGNCFSHSSLRLLASQTKPSLWNCDSFWCQSPFATHFPISSASLPMLLYAVSSALTNFTFMSGNLFFASPPATCLPHWKWPVSSSYDRRSSNSKGGSLYLHLCDYSLLVSYFPQRLIASP